MKNANYATITFKEHVTITKECVAMHAEWHFCATVHGKGININTAFFTHNVNTDKMNSLPALNGISCLWKTEGMETPHHLSIIADLQYVLYKIICH